MRIVWKARYFLFSLEVHHHSLRDADLRSQPLVLGGAVQVRRVGPAEQAKPGSELAEAKLWRERIRKHWKTRYFLFSLDALHRRVGVNALRGLSGQFQVRRVDPAEQAKLVKQERASPVIVRAREVGEATDDAYLGVGYDRFTGGVLVWRVGGGQPPEVAARYTALATPDVPVTVIDTLLSQKQNRVLQDAISQDRDWWEAEGIRIQTCGVHGPAGTFRIGVWGLTPAITEKLNQRYGDAYYGRDKISTAEEHMVPWQGPPVPNFPESVKKLKADPIIRDMAAKFYRRYRSGQVPDNGVAGLDAAEEGVLLKEYYRRGGQVESGIGSHFVAISELIAEWDAEHVDPGTD